MQTIIAIEKVVLVRIDEADGALHIYMEGFEKPFLIDQDDENYKDYLEKFTSRS